MRGHLPKAYLRIDPNIDQHPDALGMLKLICAANRQHPRGYFQRPTVLNILGRKRLGEFTALRPGKARPDLVELPDGRLYLEGWEHWQEGDWTVGERVQRLREKRSIGVTQPLRGTVTKPLPPSEALRRQGVKAAGTETNLPTPPAPADPEPPPTPTTAEEATARTIAVIGPPVWNQRACEIFARRYGGTVPGARITKALRPLVGKHGEEPVLAAFARYVDETEAEYVSAERFAATYGHWAGTAKGGGKQTRDEGTLAATARFIARGKP